MPSADYLNTILALKDYFSVLPAKVDQESFRSDSVGKFRLTKTGLQKAL